MLNTEAKVEAAVRCSIILSAGDDSSRLSAYLQKLSERGLPRDYELVVVNGRGLEIDERQLRAFLPAIKVLDPGGFLSQEQSFNKAAMVARGRFLLFVSGFIEFDKQILEESINDLAASGEKMSVSANKNFVLVESSFHIEVGGLKKLFVAQIKNSCVKTNGNNVDVLQQLKDFGLWQEGRPLRLHLGCGQQHFDGYINIDYPPSEHNLTQVKADIYANISSLDFPLESVDEIRLQHVFEHFNRVTALAMLIKWNKWLKIGGRIHIETPDLIGSAKTLVSNALWKTKMGVVRHLAGDQTANWGYHIDHWFPERFEHTLSALGFDSVQTLSSSWSKEPYLSNVKVIAVKSKHTSLPEQLKMADELLWESTVAPEEKTKWEIWKNQLRVALSSDSVPLLSNIPKTNLDGNGEKLNRIRKGKRTIKTYRNNI